MVAHLERRSASGSSKQEGITVQAREDAARLQQADREVRRRPCPRGSRRSRGPFRR